MTAAAPRTLTAPPGPARQPPRRPWRGDTIVAATALTLAVVTALWVANGGPRALVAGTGSGLTSAGRLAGLLAADLLLLQVLAMARIPWAERTWGQDRLARWHRVAGFSSFTLLLTHIGLVTVGYAATSRTGIPAQLWTLVATYPGMLLAAAGTALLTMTVVTSVRAARRRLRYESWHLLHLYAYLGIALSLPHQLWTGADFVASPVARAYWWGLYLAALGAVLVFRLGVPVWRSLRHRLVVSDVVDEAPGIVSLHIAGRRLDRLPVRAGQFFVWRFLHGPGWTRGHPFSLSATPHPGRLRVTVKDLGDGSRSLGDVPPGTRVVIEGPYGALTGERRTRAGVTLLAAGIGVTPLRALLEELRGPRGEVTLLYRARDESDLVFRAELEALAAQHGVRVVPLVGSRARPDSWLPVTLAHLDDTEALRRLVPGVAGHDVFICGPDPWMDSAERAVRGAGVPAANIHTERFSW